ncbi:MAG: type II secretion system protein GspG [Gemmatimonadetes bacterium]|nr:type II secretion system protein GspG [Gemmatimonadota bacterium]
MQTEKGTHQGSRERGFTLIELLVVVVILAILAAAGTQLIGGETDKARYSVAKSNIATLKNCLERFRQDVGRYPEEEEGLQSLVFDPGIDGWDGPYYNKMTIVDPWEHDYIYRFPAEESPFDYDLVCTGRDGEVGGEEPIDIDIVSWDL